MHYSYSVEHKIGLILIQILPFVRLNNYSLCSNKQNRIASIKFLCVVQHFSCLCYVLGVSVYSKGKFLAANVLYLYTQCYSPVRQSELHGFVTDVC